MKKHLFVLISIILVFSMFLAACSGNKASTDGDKESGGKGTKLELWTFNELHGKYYDFMVKEWNKENPDKQINLTANVYPYDDMHNKLLVAIQSGKGAPDIADIEVTKFPNYLKGQPQLLPLNDVVEPEKENIVQSRLDIYAKDGNYYGIDFHVGASVIYYNKEILDKAGVNPDDIKTWDDYAKAGKVVLEKTGVPMTTLETADHWSLWPQVAQLEGSDDLIDAKGDPNLDDPKILEILKYQQNLIEEGIAVTTPGNNHHSEEYYGFMNNGGAASVWMPMWYMGRFTDYMPDLKNKIVIKPMPAWEEGGPRSAGMGGTGTAVTTQSENPDLAKEFIAFAKLSKEGNIQLWKQLGFDPPRTEVWDMPELKEENKFTEYFGTDIFDTLIEVKDEIEGVNINENTPKVTDILNTQVLFRTLVDGEDPEKVLKEASEQLK
ncbi:ABC transporter substrate-binding protein [Metabacillus sediminilitoris]|uniref:Sugar ABC transporter substrate-binding protein n=1 Tax=Metabacillus sediminilitoris TaxID=2567941 RepID=A0A4S4BKK4_9BACI|nr:sugar ABC transporter substrate-binding protein [Metabacillus sediminilitoris]QGQ45068.1 extracellular solute-binding protein [Metabacillus sediminilitoris]THF74651.1 sugar ABC transporter substrate-binding protein [Metabacillus sediminilitoris]